MSEDGFVELSPPGKAPVKVADVVISMFRLRSSERLSLSIATSLFGAERVVIAWNPTTFEIRLTADQRGAFDMKKGPGKGSKRHVVRIDLPKGVQVSERKEPGPSRVEGKSLYVVIPPPMRIPPSKTDVIQAARAAVPAPSFSTRKL